MCENEQGLNFKQITNLPVNYLQDSYEHADIFTHRSNGSILFIIKILTQDFEGDKKKNKKINQ
jgi:hypothetical protein